MSTSTSLKRALLSIRNKRKRTLLYNTARSVWSAEIFPMVDQWNLARTEGYLRMISHLLRGPQALVEYKYFL